MRLGVELRVRLRSRSVDADLQQVGERRLNTREKGAYESASVPSLVDVVWCGEYLGRMSIIFLG